MKENNKLNVCVIFGGKSTEHDISIISGIQVYNALDKSKYNAFVIYIDKENKAYMGKNLHLLKTYKKENIYKHTKKVSLINEFDHVYIKQKRKKIKIDCFIPVVHGEGVEDGTLSAILDFVGATYITSNITSSSIAQDKIFTKDILRKYHIITPRYLWVKQGDSSNNICENIKTKLKFPLIIKPARLGSSIGIEVVNNEAELIDKINKAFMYSNRLIVEEKIENFKEYNCAAFIFKNKIYTSCIEEVLSSNPYLTFEDKYISGKAKQEEQNRIIPASIPKALEEKIKNLTKIIYQVLDFRGVIRIDFMYDVKKELLYFNEVNTIPGSFAYYLFDKCDISFDKMLDMLIKESILKSTKDQKLIKVFKSNLLNTKSLKLNK